MLSHPNRWFARSLFALAAGLILTGLMLSHPDEPDPSGAPADDITLIVKGPERTPEGWPSSIDDLAEGLTIESAGGAYPPQDEGPEETGLIMFLGRYEGGRLASSHMSRVMATSDMQNAESVRSIVSGDRVRGAIKEAGEDLIPSDMFFPGDTLTPEDLFLPGDMLFPTEENEPGAPLRNAGYMREWETELGDIDVDWDRQQALVVVAAPYHPEYRDRARLQPFIIMFDAQ